MKIINHNLLLFTVFVSCLPTFRGLASVANEPTPKHKSKPKTLKL